MVDEWQEDMSAPNPFEETLLGMCCLVHLSDDMLTRNPETTQEDVERELLSEEKAESHHNEDLLPVHTTTASMFLSMGLDLEHQQWVKIICLFLLMLTARV